MRRIKYKILFNINKTRKCSEKQFFFRCGCFQGELPK